VKSKVFDDKLISLGVDLEISQSKVGFIDHYEQEIYLRSDVNEQLQSETLIHELLHAVLEDSGITALNGQKLENIEEIVVSILSPRLSALLLDNN
jgi:hypothetical protein